LLDAEETDQRHNAAWRVRNLRVLAAATEDIGNDKTFTCAGPTWKALHYAAFREKGTKSECAGRFVTDCMNRDLQ
jgi:hypothetical protein